MVKQRIDERPNYFNGQLLLEDDFLKEQQYHMRARQLHNLYLHGRGIVYGLELEPAGHSGVTVEPGLAIDEHGREIFIRNPISVDLSKFSAGDTVQITLLYEEEKPGTEDKRSTIYAVVNVTPERENAEGLTLGIIALDKQGHVHRSHINRTPRKYSSSVLAPGSVVVNKLEQRLQKGWVRLPFRPTPLERGPKGEEQVPPPFRVGVTEARSVDEIDGKKNDRGAGGSMALLIPLGVARITRFRVAGENNESGIHISLMLSGWDAKKKEHVRKQVLDIEIAASASDERGKTAYESTFDITEGEIDSEYNTLSLRLQGHGKTSVSLVAAEFGY